jgi:sugar O-acyltransferase (sialic acid O-acetyltransferase NeuD family)
MSDLVIFGTGGFAREVHQIVEDINQEKRVWNFLGFLDGDKNRYGSEVHNYEVLGGVEWLSTKPDVSVAVGIGNTASKRKVVRSMMVEGIKRFARLIHPRAWIGNNVVVGEGTIICADTLITTDISIGKHVILNLDCTVGHDTIIEDYSTIAPSVNISGSVKVGQGCDLGTNSTIIQGVNIGHWSIVGAGAVVVRDLDSNVTAVGNPAKVIKTREEGWQNG